MSDETKQPDKQPKPITPIGLKFVFLAKVLSDPDSRNKRRPRLTAFDGAVLSVLVDRYNAERGYSFTGCRAIADIVNASPEGVAKSIRKMKTLEIIVEAGGGFKNRAQRLAPNFDSFVNGYAVHSTVNGHGVHAAVNGYAVDAPSTAIECTDTLVTRTKRKGNGTYGASPAARAGARARSAPSPSPKKILSMINRKNKADG